MDRLSKARRSEMTSSLTTLGSLFRERSSVFDARARTQSPATHRLSHFTGPSSAPGTPIIERQGSEPLAKFESNDFHILFDILDVDETGELGHDMMLDFHQEIHECPKLLTQAQCQAAIHKVTKGKTVSKKLFLDVVVELHNRCNNLAALKWDFDLFDETGNGVITEDAAKLLFQAAPGYTDEKFKKWSDDRPTNAKVNLEDAYEGLVALNH